MSEVWSKWIEHDGRGCPVGVIGRLAQCEFHAPRPLRRSDFAAADTWRVVAWSGGAVCIIEGVAANGVAWDDRNFASVINGTLVGKIVRYRLRRPDALRQLIDLVEGLPDLDAEPVLREGVPA